MATSTAAANTELGRTQGYNDVDRSWSPKAGTTNAAPSASSSSRVAPLIDESRDAEYAAKLVKHSLIGAASAAFSRLVWLTPIFNYKTELQTDDLVMSDLVEEDMLQTKRRREMAREDWWNYIWRGLTSEFALQSGLFLLSRAVWHNKRYGLLNYLGDSSTQRIVTTNSTGDAVMSTIVTRREHNLFTTVLQNALTSTILYPLYKYRVQKALCLDSEADERELPHSGTIVNNQYSATTTNTTTTTTAPQLRRRSMGAQYTTKQPKFFLFNADFNHVQNESFKSYFLYNVLLGAGSFFIERLLRDQWFSGAAKNRALSTAADAREESTWSYYLAQTITKILLNPLEVAMKKKIVEDSVGGAGKIKSNLDRAENSGFGEYFKGALFTIPEMLLTGVTEFYMYRWLNRSISPHDRDE